MRVDVAIELRRGVAEADAGALHAGVEVERHAQRLGALRRGTRQQFEVNR